MEIKKIYRLSITDDEDDQVVAQFEFNTINEVKIWLKKMGTNTHFTSSSDYRMKLFEVVFEWTMSTGVVTITSTLVNLDS